MENNAQGSAAETAENQMHEINALLKDEDFNPEPQSANGNSADSGQSVDAGPMLGTLIGTVCAVVASRKGEHWLLKEAESEAVGDALAAVMDKYMPDMDAGPEMALVVTVGMVFGPRLLADLSQAETDKDAGNDVDQSKAKSGE